MVVEEERGESPNGQAAPSAKPFQLKKEKSTAILLAIIVVFLACHLLRFIVQVYEVVSSPLHGGQKLFEVILDPHSLDSSGYKSLHFRGRLLIKSYF